MTGPPTIAVTYGRELTVGDFILAMARAWEMPVDDVLRLVQESSRSCTDGPGALTLPSDLDLAGEPT